MNTPGFFTADLMEKVCLHTDLASLQKTVEDKITHLPEGGQNQLIAQKFLTAIHVAIDHVESMEGQWRDERELWDLSFERAAEMSEAGLLNVFDIIDFNLIDKKTATFLMVYPKIWFAFAICASSFYKINL